MKIVRANNVAAVDLIEPVMLADTDLKTKEHYVSALKSLLLNEPQNTYVLIAVEQDSVVGFLAAYAPPGYQFVLVSQCWMDVKKSPDPRLADRFFLRLLQWSDSIGRTQLRMETDRNDEAFIRRWGFVAISHTMKLDIEEGFEARLVNALSHTQLKEISNGQEFSTENSVNADQRTEGHIRDAGDVSQEQHGSGGFPMDPRRTAELSAGGNEPAVPTDPGNVESIGTERLQSSGPESHL